MLFSVVSHAFLMSSQATEIHKKTCCSLKHLDSRMLVHFDTFPAQIRARQSGKRTLQTFIQTRHLSFSISKIPRDNLALCKYGSERLESCFLSTSH